MTLSIDLSKLLSEEELREVISYSAELYRCRRRLLELIPGLEQMNETDLENFLITDRPEIASEIATLLQTMKEEREELGIILRRVQEEVLDQFATLVLGAVQEKPVDEIPVEGLEAEERLANVLKRLPKPVS